MSPVRLSVPTKWVILVCLVAFFAFVLSILPVHHDATAQGSRPRRTQGPLSRNLPNLDEVCRIELVAHKAVSEILIIKQLLWTVVPLGKSTRYGYAAANGLRG